MQKAWGYAIAALVLCVLLVGAYLLGTQACGEDGRRAREQARRMEELITGIGESTQIIADYNRQLEKTVGELRGKLAGVEATHRELEQRYSNLAYAYVEIRNGTELIERGVGDAELDISGVADDIERVIRDLDAPAN